MVSKKELEKRLKKWKVSYFILASMLIFLFSFLLTEVFPIMKSDEVSIALEKNKTLKPMDIVNITYENLTKEEIYHFEAVFNQINPLYLNENTNFIITNNIDNYCDDCGGQNTGYGRVIVVKYYDNPEILEEIISHEVMHTIIKGAHADNYLHDIVYDLGDKKVAFK